MPENSNSDSITSPLPVEATLLTSPAPQAVPGLFSAPFVRSLVAPRAWIVVLALMISPILTYWSATFHDYGLRDGYSNLRESHEEPGKIVSFCASHARPIYGWLLENTFKRIDTIGQLQWIRLVASMLLGAIGIGCYQSFRRAGWAEGESALTAVWITLLPAAQVIAGWSIGWPYALASLASLAAFAAAESALAAGRTPSAMIGWLAAAFVMLIASTLTYQPSAMFYAVPLAAVFIARIGRRPNETVRWIMVHLGLVCSALILAFFFMRECYAHGIFFQSPRVALEQHWLSKLSWFLRVPLPNALSLFVINDDNKRDWIAYVASASLAGITLVAGAWLVWSRHGWQRGMVWIAGLAGLPLFAFSTYMVATERYATYRTEFALTAVLLCFLVASSRMLLQRLHRKAGRWVAATGLAGAFVFAGHHAYALLAVPQGNEWKLVLEGAAKVHLGTNLPRVFIIEPSVEDISTLTIYHDEFGSLSSNSEWVPKEMFKRAMHDLHPKMIGLDHLYRFSSGAVVPRDQTFDVIIDMHQLREFRTNSVWQ